MGEEPIARRKKKFSKKQFVFIGGALVALLIVGLAGAGGYYYSQYQKIKKNPQTVVKQDTQNLVEKVSKLIDVPKDEEPTVAAIADKSKLKDQPFFSNAENGDKILIFTKAKKAIIYRESTNRLINVGPLNIDDSALVGVGILGAGGNVQAAQKTITDKLGTTMAVVFSGDAKNKNVVKKTTVIDVSGKNAEAAKQLAEALGADTASSLPAGETAPSNSSVVVIVK